MAVTSAVDPGPRRASRTSARQFRVLLDYIESHPCMVSARVPSSYGERERHWQVVAGVLNADPVSVPKGKDKWKKTWFDWKCNVRSKARTNGTKNLTPLEKRLINLTGLIDGEDADVPSSKSEPASNCLYEADEQFSSEWNRSQSQDSNGVSPPAEASFGEHHEEYIVPTPDGHLSSDVVSDRIIVLSDVRSLSSPCGVKEEPINVDDEVVSVEFQPQNAARTIAPAGNVITGNVTPRNVIAEDCSRRRDPQPSASNVERRHTPSSSNTSLLEMKAKLEVEVLLATKRKLEAEERRADAEAEFFREEKRRASSLVMLHEEEQRKVAAMAEFHREERHKAHAKAELLIEHRRFFVEQQRTEVLRRKLLFLELKKARQDLSSNPSVLSP